MQREESEKKLIVYANQTCSSVMTTYLGTIQNLRWILTWFLMVFLRSAVKVSVCEVEAQRTVLKDDFCRG